MDKITTPIAVLISGILIFIGLYLNYSTSRYYMYESTRGGDNVKILNKLDIFTGQLCIKKMHYPEKWGCYSAPKVEFDDS
jgi:hypothetical protein